MRTPWKLAALVAFPVAALATTLVPHSLKDRAAKADRVVLAQVIETHVERTGNPGLPLKTYTRLLIGEDLKGSGPREVTVVQLGGRDGATTMQIPGDAVFEPGQTAIVFLRCRLAVDRCHLVAMGEGVLRVTGSTVRVQDLTTHAFRERTVTSLRAELSEAAK